jgi:hypothetical protein
MLIILDHVDVVKASGSAAYALIASSKLQPPIKLFESRICYTLGQ